MAISDRTKLFTVETVNRNDELDYLASNYQDLELSTSDLYTITSATQYRPDLISLKFFGNYNFGWLISLHNSFLDPIFDFEIGVTIKIPNIEEFYRFYNRNSRS